MPFDSSGLTVRSQLHNSTLPAANTDLLGAAVGPTAATSGAVNFKVYVCCSIAGNLILRRTRSAVTVSEQIAALTANVVSIIDNIPVDQGETINLQLSTTTGTMLKLMLIENPFAE